MIRVHFDITTHYAADIPAGELEGLPNGSFQTGKPEQNVAELLEALGTEIGSGDVTITEVFQHGGSAPFPGKS